ncbi:MAG: hypothetical protein U9M95_06570 [Candidatus Altiarchaeota archaeon]|nr:hypothetical protein [Candidatus Altiarchaeota archaeon]
MSSINDMVTDWVAENILLFVVLFIALTILGIITGIGIIESLSGAFLLTSSLWALRSAIKHLELVITITNIIVDGIKFILDIPFMIEKEINRSMKKLF